MPNRFGHPQEDAEAISRLIKDRIEPFPDFLLVPEKEEGKNILALIVYSGRSTPYYYKADGVIEAYIRLGNESIPAPAYSLNALVLKGTNRTYDALVSEHDFEDCSFSKLRERYKAYTGNSLDEKFFDSFVLVDKNGKLTNAGALLADEPLVRQSRLFCNRWNGLDKSGGMVDALDHAEFAGSLIILLNEGLAFVKRNMRTIWKKTPNSRLEMPDYCERSVFEALVNALVHRDYLILGSEVHIDIYDDRLTIVSPGGMADGTFIQDRDIYGVASLRRNPILADIFAQLGYMERQGSGFRKISDAYKIASNYKEGMDPVFVSDSSSFQVTLPNLNYGAVLEGAELDEGENVAIGSENVAIGPENVAIGSENVAIEDAFDKLGFNKNTVEKFKKIFKETGFDGIFGRKDIASITGGSLSGSWILISKLRKAGLIEEVQGSGKGKYRFRKPTGR